MYIDKYSTSYYYIYNKDITYKRIEGEYELKMAKTDRAYCRNCGELLAKHNTKHSKNNKLGLKEWCDDCYLYELELQNKMKKNK